jgi:starch-binding outer membrane protein, SusD/RagB family
LTQNNPIDIPILRYADELLCLAEVLNEQGTTQEAIEYVNMVRNRAGVAPLSSNGNTQATDKSNI